MDRDIISWDVVRAPNGAGFIGRIWPNPERFDPAPIRFKPRPTYAEARKVARNAKHVTG